MTTIKPKGRDSFPLVEVWWGELIYKLYNTPRSKDEFYDYYKEIIKGERQ